MLSRGGEVRERRTLRCENAGWPGSGRPWKWSRLERAYSRQGRALQATSFSPIRHGGYLAMSGWPRWSRGLPLSVPLQQWRRACYTTQDRGVSIWPRKYHPITSKVLVAEASFVEHSSLLSTSRSLLSESCSGFMGDYGVFFRMKSSITIAVAGAVMQESHAPRLICHHLGCHSPLRYTPGMRGE